MKRTIKSGLKLFVLCIILGGWGGCESCGILGFLTPDPAPIREADSIKMEVDDDIELIPSVTSSVLVRTVVTGGSKIADVTITSPMPTGVRASITRPSVRDPYTLTFESDSTAVAGEFGYTLSAIDPQGSPTPTVLTGVAHIFKPFDMSASSASAGILGVPQTITVTLSRARNFGQPIGLVALASPNTATATLAQSSVTGSSTTMQLTLPSILPVGQYITQVIGKFGASQDTANIFYQVFATPVPPEITITATPSVTIAPGANAVFDIALGRTAPGIPNIDLSVSGLPTGATFSFNPASVTAGSSQLTVANTGALRDSTYQLTITGTAGSIVKSTTVSLVVLTPQNLTMTVAPTALTVARGTTGQASATFVRTGAVGAITVDAPTLPATGVAVVATPVSANQTTSTLTFAVSPTAAPGQHTITVHGRSGAFDRPADVVLTIPAPPPGDVDIQLLTPNASVPLGGTIQIPVRLTRRNAAVGQLLALTNTAMPGGGYAWISPSSTTGDSATLYVIGGTVGPATVTVSAVFGATPPTDVASVNVQATASSDFSIAPAPATLTLSAGPAQQMAVIIGRTNSFASAVSFQGIGDAPGNFNITFSLNSTTGTGIGMTVQAVSGIAEGPHVITIRGTSGAIVREVKMTVIVIAGQTYPYPYPYYPGGIKRPPPQ